MNPSALRSMVARWLTDTCTINDAAPAPVFDPETGYSSAGGAAVYAGACRIRPAGASGRDVGDAPIVLHSYLVTIPWDAVGIAINQVVTITDSDDPDMVDRTFRVVDVEGGTGNPHRRLTVEQILDDAIEEP